MPHDPPADRGPGTVGRQSAGGLSSRNVSPRFTEYASTLMSASSGRSRGSSTSASSIDGAGAAFPVAIMAFMSLGPFPGPAAVRSAFRVRDLENSTSHDAFQQPDDGFDNQRESAKVGAVDLDLAQVRAFLATADGLHFGHAAEQLSLSQQALSKRIARIPARRAASAFRGRSSMNTHSAPLLCVRSSASV